MAGNTGGGRKGGRGGEGREREERRRFCAGIRVSFYLVASFRRSIFPFLAVIFGAGSFPSQMLDRMRIWKWEFPRELPVKSLESRA